MTEQEIARLAIVCIAFPPFAFFAALTLKAIGKFGNRD